MTSANDDVRDSPVDPANGADLACLRRVAAGDRAAFEQLYRRYHPRLSRFLRRFSARLDLADEVINDTLWIVWRKAAEFRGDSKVSTWITGIAYRCMLKSLRGTAPAEELGESLLDALELEQWAGAQHDAAPDRELRDWVACGLRTLPEDQRVTLELAYLLGYSCEEIAGVMDCAVGTVKARMFHARVRLRSVMPALGEGRRSAKG
jgi:RNA polymerase sigma-70 factor (ECF subfamily)